MIPFTGNSLLDWIFTITWALCAIQTWRLVTGFVFEGGYVDGEDVFMCFLGCIIGTLIAPIAVLVRFVYWAWNYYELEKSLSQANSPISKFAISPDIESKRDKKARIEREARQRVDSLRGEVAERRS